MLNIHKYKKIIIIGSGGSGKSTFSRQLGKITGLPVIHLDREYWQPGWVETPKDEWAKKQEELIKGERWIIDGNYGGTMELRFKAAELIFFLDISRVICVLSAAGRTGKKRPDLPAELKEPKMLSKDFFEFARFIWNYPKRSKPKVMALRDKYPEKPFIHIKKRKELEEYLKAEREHRT